MSATIPGKRYFRIGEVAKLAGIPPYVLRYWEREFKEIKPQRAGSNQRLYSRQDVETVLKIRILLKEQGYTIAGAKKILHGEPVNPERMFEQFSNEVEQSISGIERREDERVWQPFLPMMEEFLLSSQARDGYFSDRQRLALLKQSVIELQKSVVDFFS